MYVIGQHVKYYWVLTVTGFNFSQNEIALLFKDPN